jgi:type II secretory pathway component PulC
MASKEKAMKKLMALMAMAVTVSLTGNVLAHGEKPKHGGIVQSNSEDISFELVNKDGKPEIYIEDHEKPVATEKLTVLNGADKTDVMIEPVGTNGMVTKGVVKLGNGANAIATVTFADKKTVNVRFSIK